MARVDDVEIAAERLGVDDLDGDELAFGELVCDGDPRKEAEAELAFHHALGGFDGFDFEDDIREKAGAAEKALTERPIARAAIVKNQRPFLHFFEAGLAFAGSFVRRVADEHQRIVAQGHGFDFGMIQRAGDADFGVAVEDHFQDLRGIAGTDRDHRFRVGSLVVLDDVWKEIGANRKRGGDIERAAGGGLKLVDGLAGESDGAEKLLGMRAERLAGGRERNAGAAAFEKRHPERVFEGVNAGADGGLADAKRFGGAMEAAIGDDGEERFDLVDFHERLRRCKGIRRLPGPARRVPGRLYRNR